MILTASKIRDAYLVLAVIINDKRNLPQATKYKIARMYQALEKEGQLVEQQRNEIIAEIGEPVLKDDIDTGMKQVPPEKMPEYLTRWKSIADIEIDVPVQAIAISALGDDGQIEAAEFLALGDLITE